MINRKRQKKTLLQEVYNDNQRLLGRDVSTPKKRVRLITLILFLCLGTGSAFYFGLDQIDLSPPAPISEIQPSSAEQEIRTSNQQIASSDANVEATSLSDVYGLRVRTIALDPGHGGRDPGAVGQMGLFEKTLTLDLALRLERRLKAKGLNVFLTRRDDTYLSLRQRVQLVKQSQADLFISIHLNALPVDTVAFIETFYFSPRGDARAEMVAAQENTGSDYSIGEWQNRLEAAGQTVRIEESRLLASHIQDAMVVQMRDINNKLADWGARSGPFMLLMNTDVPAILAEVTAISMPEEEKRLMDIDYREMLAHGLEIGILSYLSQ
ncbi:MAG: N-acetylmuramoyl-L-alanine amidase [Bacteroidetes bacterium]|nr:N-acetylmuramoyl-L-alanine amidase [Bacteroidota bacterium]MCY4233287.1 N-acetylmuramoyl-L-alanine amidase [Bacteroidota bacterium]